MKIKQLQYDQDMRDAYKRGVVQGRIQGSEEHSGKAAANLRLARDWRTRYEALKANGPDLKAEIEAAYTRGMSHGVMQVRGQLVDSLNNLASV